MFIEGKDFNGSSGAEVTSVGSSKAKKKKKGKKKVLCVCVCVFVCVIFLCVYTI